MTNFQIPNPNEIPTFNDQNPMGKRSVSHLISIENWSLEFNWDLGFGNWDFPRL
jgi:hypothetical protein